MTTPKRPAKSGKSWTFKELDAYNVRIKTVNIQEFFGISHGQLPAPAVDPLILENFDLPDNLVVRPPSNVVNFFIYLHDTTDKGQPASVDDFTHHLLGGVLGFDLPDGVALTRDTFPFIMSGQRVKTIPNVSVRRAGYQIILVQKDKVSLPLFPCCRASLNIYTNKDISRASRASAGGHRSGSIFRGQRKAHCKWAVSNGFQKVHWNRHD